MFWLSMSLSIITVPIIILRGRHFLHRKFPKYAKNNVEPILQGLKQQPSNIDLREILRHCLAYCQKISQFTQISFIKWNMFA